MAIAVKAEGLTKTYRFLTHREPVNAVSDLNLEVQEGEIFGFLGPNGAGKTTTIKMLLGLVYPTSGSARILDRPAGDIEVKRQISYLPETPYFYDFMSGYDVLSFYGQLFGLKGSKLDSKIIELLKIVGLYSDRNKNLNQYSKGMLQRIGIAQALVNDPKLLIFDEPTSGLDPIAHSEISDLILNLRDQGKTVFLSSHQLSDVELVCDRVAILNKGKMLKTGHLNELLTANHVEITLAGVDGAAKEKLSSMAERSESRDGSLVLQQQEGDKVGAIIDAARAAKCKVVSVIPQRRTLEDMFVEIIRGVNK
jgi:ABC-2 type transport system ATP-binding protein